jgi:hypothetical protein
MPDIELLWQLLLQQYLEVTLFENYTTMLCAEIFNRS